MEQFTFHHIGIAVRDLKSALSAYKNLFGYDLISGPIDDPIQNVSACFLSRGKDDMMVEIVAPLGPNSPIDLILKKGGGTYHICYQVEDIRAAIEHLVGQGSFLLGDPVPAIAYDMREIAWLMTDVGLLVELVQA